MGHPSIMNQKAPTILYKHEMMIYTCGGFEFKVELIPLVDDRTFGYIHTRFYKNHFYKKLKTQLRDFLGSGHAEI